MTAPTPDDDQFCRWDGVPHEPHCVEEQGHWQCQGEPGLSLIARLAAVTAERDDARREVEHQKWIKAKNTEVLTGLLDQARRMLAAAPHEGWCPQYHKRPEVTCMCWKAGL